MINSGFLGEYKNIVICIAEFVGFRRVFLFAQDV